MSNRFVQGLAFGAGFGIALIAVVAIAFIALAPRGVSFRSGGKPAPRGTVAEVVPIEPHSERKFELHPGRLDPMQIPPGGGMLSIAVLDAPKDNKRPNTFQVWITASDAFIVRTSEETPTVTRIDPPTSVPNDYANQVVHDNVGIVEENSTSTVDAGDIQRLKNGQSIREGWLNGELRITKDGVVFFVPNPYET